MEQAALTLYKERGFTQTTVAEIAERAGLTERTFFRHFSDKREVLFSGAEAFQRQLVNALDDAPSSLSPIDAVGNAVESVARLFDGRRELARKRHAVISKNPELQERERIKLASLATALTIALRRRGVREPEASLAAEMGVAVLRVAFQRWILQPGDRDLARAIRESFDALKLVTAGK
ncbi:MAG TPA: TetR family transcriptional regulator [Candidatus Tumulicola sp.]|nr:TetR family transcriptional regulator [Candidatus Tumulicola sp.]